MANQDQIKKQTEKTDINAAQSQMPKWHRITLPEGLFDQTDNNVETKIAVEGQAEIHVKDNAQSDETFKSAISQNNDNDQNNNHNGEVAWLLDKRLVSRLDDSILAWIRQHATKNAYIHSKARIGRDETPVVRMTTALASTDSQFNHIASDTVVVDDQCALTLVMDYDNQSAMRGQHLGITRLIVGRGAVATLFKCQRLGAEDAYLDQTLIEVAEGGEVNIVDVQLGSRFRGVNYSVALSGRHSRATLNSLYLGCMAQRMDLSFTMNHIGANTESVIESKGALDGNAKKVFRGNLQFEQGAAKSVGRERETVMLLDERVHAESIPALLCAEDDVIGEHAASIGRVDQQKLFYLMSRGLTMAAAKKLVVKAAFEEVLAEAATVNLRDEIEALIDRRLS